MTREQARQLRKLLENSTNSMTDEEIIRFPAFVEKWRPGIEYKTEKRVYHNDVIYKVLQPHTSQEGWEPDAAPSLFAEVLIQTDEDGQQVSIDEWKQPDSTNTYTIGDVVKHNGKIWRSTYNNNSWEPGVFGWELVPDE